MKKYILVALVVALYAAHQDLWFWETARPLVFGFLPIGLFYHGCFSVVASLLMVLLVKIAWPAPVERRVDEERRSLAKGD